MEGEGVRKIENIEQYTDPTYTYANIVKLHSLKKAPQYNDKEGVVIRLPTEKAEHKYGICLKDGKQLLCSEKNLQLVQDVVLDEDFWYSFSYLSRELLVEKGKLMFKHVPFDQFPIGDEVLRRTFNNSCKLMLPVMKKWETQADVLKHIVVMLDRRLGEHWLKYRPKEKTLGKRADAVLKLLLMGVHGTDFGSDVISNYDDRLKLFTSCLWHKNDHLGTLEIETIERLHMNKAQCIAFAQSNSLERLDEEEVQVERFDLELKKFQRDDDGKIYKMSLKSGLPILPAVVLYFPWVLHKYLPELDNPDWLYVSMIDTNALFVFVDQASCCFAYSQERDYKSPIYRIKRDHYRTVTYSLAGWEKFGEHWEWDAELVVELPPTGPRPSTEESGI